METLNEQLEGGNMSKEATTGLQLSHINNQTEWSFQVWLTNHLCVTFQFAFLFILFEQIILVQGQKRRLKILFLADNFLISSISQGFTKNKIVEHCLADLTDNASTSLQFLQEN